MDQGSPQHGDRGSPQGYWSLGFLFARHPPRAMPYAAAWGRGGVFRVLLAL